MSTNLFQKPNVNPPEGRNGFDMSRRRLYTCSVGQLLPTYFDFATGGDKYKLNTNSFVRTEAIQTAAMVRLKLHNEWFFVPFRQLYAFWNEFYNMVNDIHTNFVTPSDEFDLPTFNLSNVVSNFENQSTLVNVKGNIVSLQTDEFWVPKIWNMRRLFDLLGYGDITRTNKLNLNVCLLNYLAYHKIFYSRYNKEDWFSNKPSLYNVDSYHGQGIPDSVGIPIISTLHYRPWRPDYFNNIYPNPTFNNQFASMISSSIINQEGDLRRFFSKEGDISNLLTAPSETGVGVNLQLSSPDYPSTFSVGDLRSMFAFDRLLRTTGYAGSKYSQQTYAHLGVKLPEGLQDDAYVLGSQEVDININEVVAQSTTATTSGSSTTVKGAGTVIGDIAGKGFGVSQDSKPIVFKCPESGIIMCISSIEPILDYNSSGVEVVNRYKDSFDFYHPEFDNLGMQPFESSALSTFGTVILPNPIGWQYRYSELKTKYDVVNEGFYLNTDKVTWQSNFQDSLKLTALTLNNAFDRFYINPQYTNPIFLSEFPSMYEKYVDTVWDKDHLHIPAYDRTVASGWAAAINDPANIYVGDNFLISTDFNVFKTSIMSVHSLPKL